MSGKLLDTNVIIRYIKDGNGLESLFDEPNLFFSSITLGELLFGSELSSKKEQNATLYTEFCQELKEIKVDASVAPFYAKIKAQLKSDGHPIPENDIWIAACAMSQNLTVVTGDTHFSFINGIKLQTIRSSLRRIYGKDCPEVLRRVKSAVFLQVIQPVPFTIGPILLYSVHDEFQAMA